MVIVSVFHLAWLTVCTVHRILIMFMDHPMELVYLQVTFHLKTLVLCLQSEAMYLEIMVTLLIPFLIFSSWVIIQCVPHQLHQLPIHLLHPFTLVIMVMLMVIWLATLQWVMALLVLDITLLIIQTLTIINHLPPITLVSPLVSMDCMDHLLTTVSTLNWLIF